jgi:hypothetical protein
MEEHVQQVALEATVVVQEAVEIPEYQHDPDGKTWRWIDGEYCCISSGEDDKDAEEYDPVASAQLLQRTIAQFSRHHYRMSPEQHAERQRRWAAKHAERAREARARAQNDQGCRARPKPTPAPRPQTVRTRRSSARTHSTVTTHATADPSPPPEPAPASDAVSAVSTAALDGRPRAADGRAHVLRDGAVTPAVSTLLAPRPAVAGSASSASRRSPRPGPPPPLDPRLLPVARAFADLLLADLLKYPPRSS